MINKKLVELMFPNVKTTIKDYEEKYQERVLPKDAVVSRYAPSPTGFVHMGNMLACFIENKLPQQTGGIFYLRIEDTDQEREIKDGIESIVKAINIIGLTYNEGVLSKNIQRGKYGPYIQSERKEIYDTFAKYLLENDMVYPCFCDKDELDFIRKSQREDRTRVGYYGKYAKCRYLTNEERINKIKQGIPYTVRLKSTGNFNNKIIFQDLVKGKITFPENDQDIVLIKSNGIPVYHFAHVVDDHLMRTTHVLRGEDWLSSVPVHIELFNKFEFKIPMYAHLGLIMIVDENGVRRKISKRKDKDFTVESYHNKGFPSIVLQEYLMTIANSNFEAWRTANPDISIDKFEFSFSKMGSSPLFDSNKLINISKNIMAKMTAEELYKNLLEWSNLYDKEFCNILTNYKDYTISVLNIEREQKKPRKDFSCYSDIKKYVWFMYDELFINKDYEFSNITDKKEISIILSTYIDKYYDVDDKDVWFSKMKDMANELGYASDMKEYKNNPDGYKGSIADISMVLRVSLTTLSKTPDLYEIMKLLGKDRIRNRFELVISEY